MKPINFDAIKIHEKKYIKNKVFKLKVNNKSYKNRNKVEILSNHYIIQKAKLRICKRNKQKIYDTCIAKGYYSSNNKIKESIIQVSLILKLIK